MEGTFRRYPIGIQSFERLRNDNCVYIDKTELIYRLANSAKKTSLSRISQTINQLCLINIHTIIIA